MQIVIEVIGAAVLLFFLYKGVEAVFFKPKSEIKPTTQKEKDNETTSN